MAGGCAIHSTCRPARRDDNFFNFMRVEILSWHAPCDTCVGELIIAVVSPVFDNIVFRSVFNVISVVVYRQQYLLSNRSSKFVSIF